MLLLLRYHESDMQLLRLRLQIAKTLVEDSASVPWKRCNYFALTFLPLSSNFADELGIERRTLGEVVQKSRTSYSKTKANVSKVLLSSRVAVPHLSARPSFLLMAVLMVSSTLYFSTAYGIFRDQQTKLAPLEQLAVDFMLFVQDIDTLICAGLLAKTPMGTGSTLDQSSKDILALFSTVFATYKNEVPRFYENLLLSD